jgi:hypothetical protein
MASQQWLVEPERKRGSIFEALFYLIGAIVLIGIGALILSDRGLVHLPQLSSAPAAPTVRAIAPAPAPPIVAQPVQDAAPPIEQAPAMPTPVMVIPQGEPRYAAAPQPTVWAPDATQTAAYDKVRGTPAPQVYGTDPTCNSANATFRTDPIKVEKNGIPIGAVQGWSCTSEADAVATAQRFATEMQSR